MLQKVLTGDLTFSSLKPCDLSNCTKSEIRAYFENSYDLNESLYSALKDDSAFYKCPDRLRLPLIFYYGHTACVYVNKLILAGLLKPTDRVNLEYETLFETGVDEMSWDDTENYRMGGKFKWPKLDDVVEYRRKVRQIILDLIEDTPLTLPVTMESKWWGLFMGMEHERIHLETSSVLIRQLPVDMVTRPKGWTYGPMRANAIVENPMVSVTGSDVTLGKPLDFPSYGWDNEYGQVHCQVPAFEASRYLVTNREFLDFVEDDGYQKPELWTDEGWKWRQYRKADHPAFWVCGNGCKSGCGADLSGYSHCKARKPSQTCQNNYYIGDFNNQEDEDAERHLVNGQNGYCNGHDVTDSNGHQGKDEGGGNSNKYRLRCMFDEVAMPWQWPAEVNYHEAKAFCTWKGSDYRLPTEAEHSVIRAEQKSPNEGTSCDIIFQDKIKANLNFRYGSPTPVGLFGASAAGFHDAAGNVWQWMEDHFNGLPGFSTSRLYDDFSCPCFDGRHNVILGGSWMSTGDEASRFARFAFRRHFFQHAGFRLARSNQTTQDSSGAKVKVPARFVNTPIYMTKVGVLDNPTSLDLKAYTVEEVPTTYSHYLQDTSQILNDQLATEYACTDSVPSHTFAQCQDWVREYRVKQHSALHIGCGTGRVTFQLAGIFDKVIGQDFCGPFIDTCDKLQRGESVTYTLTDGNKHVKNEVSIDNTHTNSLVFKQMTWLPNEVGFHDLVLLTFLNRVQNPESWTVRLREVVKATGLLVVASGGQGRQPDLDVLIGQDFRCVDTANMTDITDNASEPGAVMLSAWQHKA